MTIEKRILEAIDNAVSMGQVRRLQAQLKELNDKNSNKQIDSEKSSD